MRKPLASVIPMIWRRALVPASVSMRELLHGILQVGMGWEGFLSVCDRG